MLKVLDLFSGIGAMSLGLERAGAGETVAFCDVNPRANAVTAKHWPGVPNLGDITQADFPHADIITAGFPCQDLSYAGPGTGLTGARSGLFWEVVRALRVVRPRYAILENVAALLSRGMGAVLGALAAEGYDAEWDCIRGFDVGAPHERDRVFIAAHAKSVGRGQGRPWGLADGFAGLPQPACWNGQDPIAQFEEGQAQPALLGVDDAPPDGLDRISLCGNALFPDIPEMIGRAILAAEAARPSHTEAA